MRLTDSAGRRLVAPVLALALLASSAGVFRAARAADLPSAAGPANRPGLSRLLAAATRSGPIRGIATFDAVPGAAQVESLRGLGLRVQPMRHVPLAIVEGPLATLQSAVTGGAANDVYPDERIELLDVTSANAMGAAGPRAKGFTGKGVTVAVVDSGCDATHPDLAKRVVHNVKLYSPEYVNLRPDSSNTIVVPVEQGPYNNSDIGSGHGTHVAGIIAADGTTDNKAKHLGVAPDASLVCYSIGEVLFTTAVVTAYDHMLDQDDLWGIDVVNNSWGNSFRQFDPRDPVAVVTKVVADRGVHVVFAAGNSGYESAEMSLNPFSQAPWVLSVAAETIAHKRGNFSSNGLAYDNSQPEAVGPGGHNVFIGNGLGVYHPDVTAPGEAISSTCATTGTAVRACPPYQNTNASGTSMASPHVAGAVAVLLQANPKLTPAQARSALQSTAKPVAASADAGAGAPAPGFWQVGYGAVDLAAAVDLVRSKGYATRIADAQAAADKRVRASSPLPVVRSDFWTYDAPRATVAGSDSRSYRIEVPRDVTHVKVTLSHPSGAVIGENGMEYAVTVRDAAGKEIGQTEEATTGAGTASVLIDLATVKGLTRGMFTVDVAGQLAASDPDTFDSESLAGRTVTLQVAQLRRR